MALLIFLLLLFFYFFFFFVLWKGYQIIFYVQNYLYYNYLLVQELFHHTYAYFGQNLCIYY